MEYLKGWKYKTDSKGNLLFFNPNIVYKYKRFDSKKCIGQLTQH